MRRSADTKGQSILDVRGEAESKIEAQIKSQTTNVSASSQTSLILTSEVVGDQTNERDTDAEPEEMTNRFAIADQESSSD
jgi:hypothetical protein